MKTLEKNETSFIALDVETANADYSSICQVGIAKFSNGEVIDSWSTLINPNDYFDPLNISIHGITPNDVKGSPTFSDVHVELKSNLEDSVVVHHMPFDKTAINRACSENGLDIIKTTWLDSAKIVRRTWEEFAHRGYGLANVARHFNVTFEHHDALEDAITAGKIVHLACQESGSNIDDWLNRVNNPIFPSQTAKSIKLEGNPEGLLYGENLVFTGALTISRSEAAQVASKMGCNVSNSLTKKTTLLIVGTQDKSKLVGYEKSSKHRKAEELIGKGIPIRILSENDFLDLCKDCLE